MKNLYMNYINKVNEGWNFQVVMQQKKNNNTMIGEFKLSNEQFNELKRTANKEARYAVESMGIVFNTYEFLKFLSEKVQSQML